MKKLLILLFTLISFNTFAVEKKTTFTKELFNEAQKNGINLPITEFVDQFYKEIQTIGGGRWDTSSLLKRLMEKP